MSRFHGPQGKGAQAAAKATRRAEAEARDAVCLPHRRASWLLTRAAVRAAVDEYASQQVKDHLARKDTAA